MSRRARAVPGTGAAALLLGMALAPAEAQQNVANNPLTDIPAIQVQNYLQPVMSGQPISGADQPFLRGILPHDTFGWPQLLRASLATGTTVWGPAGTESGLGDLTLFDVPLFQLDNAKLGIGPLLILPTATSPALGERKWQAGAQAVVSAPYDWGLLAALVAYQQAFDGSARSLTIQPFLFYNLTDGFYLRSSGITAIDFGRQRAVVPVGLGLGRVRRLADGNVLNMYLEPQYSVVQSGPGQPSFQIFAGFNIQFPPGRSP
ncbi:hypothetical protein [Reyranella sp.]|uniref:hypothetical protein n=1 Tax=Reyranella sp. TaxID=1929291 RepID=UPI003C7BDE0F